MDFENVLIFRIGHLGDTIVALPALWAIRDAFPNTRITLLTNIDLKNPHYVSPRDVLPEKGIIDEWLAYPTNLGFAEKALAFLRLSLELRKRKFDAVIYLMPRIRTSGQIDRDIRFFRFSHIKKMIGADYLRKNSLTAEIPKPTPFVESESDFLLNLLDDAGLSNDGLLSKTDLLLNDAEVSSAKRWFRTVVNTEHEDKKLIAVAPGSKWASKIWNEMRYAEVVGRLISENNCYPIIFGGDEDREIGNRLITEWGTGSNAAGQVSVRESAALIAECAMYLGNDTGTMHLATAVGIPCVAIFASIDWKGRWWPTGGAHRIFRQTVECEGCFTPDCFNDHKCLNLTGTADVYKACSEVLASV